MIGRLVGGASRLPLTLLLALRSLLIRRPGQSFLTLLVLTSSVALAVTVQLTTHSLMAPIRETTRALFGNSDLDVTAGTLGVPEALVEPIRRLPAVRFASPLIVRTLMLAEGEFEGQAVRVIGVDVLEAREVRAVEIESAGIELRDPLSLIASPAAVVIPRILADRLGLGEGDSLRLRRPSETLDLTVRGTLSGPLSNAFDGHAVVMDVFGLQELLHFTGRVDRIDISVHPEFTVEQAREQIREAVGTAYAVETPRDLSFVNSVFDTVRLASFGIAGLGILLSFFLVYAIISMSMDRRIEELAVLRSIGMGARSAVGSVLLEVSALSVAATFAGFAAAPWIAGPVIAQLSQFSDFFSGLGLPAPVLDATSVWVALWVGTPVALVATLEPANRARREAPLDVLCAHRAPVSDRNRGRLWAAIAMAAALVCAVAWLVPEHRALGLAVAVIVCSVVAVSMGSTQGLLVAFRPLQRVLGWFSPRIGPLAFSSLRTRPLETGATLAVVTAITAALLAMYTTIHSLVTSLDDFHSELLGDTVLAFTQSPRPTIAPEKVSARNIEAIRTTPGVLGVDESFMAETTVNGESGMLVFSISTRDLAQYADDISVMSADPESAIAALLRGEATVDASVSRRLGIEAGDTIEMLTDRGLRSFRVGGTIRSLSGPGGSIAFDIAHFRRWFDVREARNVAFWAEQPHEAVIERVRSRLSDQALFFRFGEQRRNGNQRFFQRFKVLLLVPVVIVSMLGGFALVSLLFGNVNSRSRELAILGAIGASTEHRVGLILIDGWLVALLGVVLGSALGVLWADVMAELLGDSIGFDVRLTIPWIAFATVALGMFVLATLASAVPAAGSGRAATPGAISQLD